MVENASLEEKEERIRKLALSYYSRKDILNYIYEFSKNRECIPRYFEGFGTRPDTFQYPSDALAFVKKGATSFHCSQELWQDPLQISTELNQEQFNNLRVGWDLLLDIDSKYLDYSKIAAELIIQALEFHGIKNIGVKFSGSKGFHILIPWQAFPEEINNVKTKDMFPEWPRIISLYLKDFVKTKLIEEITKLKTKEKYVKDETEASKVTPDIVLVSPRHLFRMPYSLHEKTSLASIVLAKNKIKDFQIRDADSLNVKPIPFIIEPRKNEARELLIQALDWYKEIAPEKKLYETKELGKEKREFKKIEIKDLSENLYPPCVKKILQGLEDGRKRALFILINFYRSLDLPLEDIEKKINEWNSKNKQPLKTGYIKSQLSWTRRQKIMLPPNCDKDYYKGIAVCIPDELCKRIKNPVNYVGRKARH